MECKATKILEDGRTVRSINRNIVECKERCIISLVRSNIVLIETLWNVKIILTQRLRSLETVLIETLWNVKQTQAQQIQQIGDQY